jgi:hypothetical protein
MAGILRLYHPKGFVLTKEKGQLRLVQIFFVAPAWIDTTASLRMFVVTYNTK